MSIYSKFLELQNGIPRTVDLSTNTLSVLGLQINAATGGGAITFAAHSSTTPYTIVWPQAQAASSGYVLTNDGAGNLSWALAASPLVFADSLVNTSGTVTLVNDTATPGASSYYGTNGSSVLGYYSLPVSGINQLTGDVTAGPGTGSQVATLATVNSNVGSFGSASSVATFTVNGKGLVTAAGNTSIQIAESQVTGLAASLALYLPLAGGTMSGGIAMGGNTITGLPAGTSTGEPLTFNQLGAANGVASLDSGGKVPVAQLPNGVFVYQGLYNPSTNTPALADGVGVTGQVYYVSTAYNGVVAGAFGGASLNFSVGDLAIYNGTQWELTTPAAGVSSVNGAYGAVIMSMATANGFAGTYSGTALTVSTTLTTPVVAANGTALIAGTTTGSGSTVVLATSPTLITPALGTPSALVGTNITGTAAGLTAGTVTTNANMTGDVTSVGNATTLVATTNGTLTTLSALSLPTSQLTGTVTAAHMLPLPTNDIYVGNGSNQPAAVAMSGDATIVSSGALTLATVNTNVGSFTNASITVNAKGLITAASSGSTASTAVQTTEIAGQSFTGSTLYAIKYMMSGDSGFVAGRVFAADDNAATTDNFYAIGLVYPPTTVAIAGTIVVTEEGILNVPSHGFTVIGAPLYLGVAGACTQTAPSTSGLAVVRVGIIKDANNIWVDVVPVGVN